MVFSALLAAEANIGWLQLFRIQQETHSSAYSDLYHVVRQGFRVRDRFDVPRITVGHEAKREGDSVEVSSMEERKAIYVRHCYPDIPQIVKRVRDVVHDYTKFVESEREWKDVQRWWNFSKESRGDDPMTRNIVTPTIVEQESQDRNVAKILQAKGSKTTNVVGNATLTRLYIMTNGDRT